jgi:hypothetical protein
MYKLLDLYLKRQILIAKQSLVYLLPYNMSSSPWNALQLEITEDRNVTVVNFVDGETYPKCTLRQQDLLLTTNESSAVQPSFTRSSSNAWEAV